MVIVGDPVVHADEEGKPILTPNGKSYQFTAKHHNPWDMKESQWESKLSADAEFEVFFEADRLNSLDDVGNLYGMRVIDGLHQRMGTKGQQIAKFWFEPPGQPWHGFPLWPVGSGGNQKAANKAITAVWNAGWITKAQRKKLAKGDPI